MDISSQPSHPAPPTHLSWYCQNSERKEKNCLFPSSSRYDNFFTPFFPTFLVGGVQGFILSMGFTFPNFIKKYPLRISKSQETLKTQT